MSLRSLKYMQREMALRRQIDALQQQVGDQLEGWGRLARRTNLEHLAELGHKLSRTTGELEWSFDGLGVYGNHIAISRLVDLAAPLGQSLRWAGHDIILLEGQPPSFADNRDLVDPVVTGTFDGSFGLALSRPPVTEQPSMSGTVFERAVKRVLMVFQAANADDPRAEVLQALIGLRKNTLSGLQTLSGRLAEAGRPSWIRWQGETVVTVHPEDAGVVAETISSAQLREEETTVRAVLEGADLVSGNFHLVMRRKDRDKHYRGRAEADAVAGLRGVRLGTRVSATLLVVLLDSPFLEEPKESYVLRSITPLEDPSPNP